MSEDAAGIDPAAAEQLRRLHLIWIAFLAMVVTFLPVPWLIVDSGADTAPLPPVGMDSSLNFAALGAGASSIVAKRWWINSLRASLEGDAPASATAWTRLRTGCLITWALSESVAMLGLALGIVSRQPLESIAPVVAAGLLLYLHRPDSWPLEAVARHRVPQ
jgi:hypothetical protein